MALSRQNPIAEPFTVVVHIGLEALRELFSATRREWGFRRVSGATPGPIPRGGGGSRARRRGRRGVPEGPAEPLRRVANAVTPGPPGATSPGCGEVRCGAAGGARAGSYGEAKKISPVG